MKTIENNAAEDNEIVGDGFTSEPAKKVSAPRIAEFSSNLECTPAWDRVLGEGSGRHVCAGKVKHNAIDDATLELDPVKRPNSLRTMAGVRSTLNRLTGEAGASSLPVISVG